MPDWLAILKAYVDTLETSLGRVVLVKDQWCATPIASQAYTNAGADRTLSDVVIPAAGTFLPAGAVIQSAYALFKWRKMVDSSGAANAINAAAKTLRLKLSGAAWPGTVCITFANGQWHTAGNASEGGDMIIGDVDIRAAIALGDTINFAHRQTGSADSPTVTAASLTLYDIYTGLRIFYTLT